LTIKQVYLVRFLDKTPTEPKLSNLLQSINCHCLFISLAYIIVTFFRINERLLCLQIKTTI